MAVTNEMMNDLMSLSDDVGMEVDNAYIQALVDEPEYSPLQNNEYEFRIMDAFRVDSPIQVMVLLDLSIEKGEHAGTRFFGLVPIYNERGDPAARGIGVLGSLVASDAEARGLVDMRFYGQLCEKIDRVDCWHVPLIEIYWTVGDTRPTPVPHSAWYPPDGDYEVHLVEIQQPIAGVTFLVFEVCAGGFAGYRFSITRDGVSPEPEPYLSHAPSRTTPLRLAAPTHDQARRRCC